MGDATSTSAQGVAGNLIEAHRRLLADRTLQFDFVRAPPRQPAPKWLTSLVEFLAPILKYVFWVGVVAVVALILFFLIRELIRIRWKGRVKRPNATEDEADGWRPTAAQARLLLEEADRLAAQGLYAQAAHHLLLHSIQEVQDRRPRAIRPAFTSRDIGRMEILPQDARAAFAQIAAIVERSLFGGRPVDADGFAVCRHAYESFAFRGGWA
jgi:hypothetical protein